MSTKNKTEAAKVLIAEICNKYSEGNFIFRGTPEIFSGKPTGVNSSIYRWAKKKKAISEHHKPPQIEKEIVEKVRRLFPDKTSNIEILTDIRHYGGKVNLIDFTRSLYVALFFACNGNLNDEGMMGIIEPAKTQATQLRVVAQDSILSTGMKKFSMFF